MMDERVFYKPRYFEKYRGINPIDGKEDYLYRPIKGKYWQERDKGTWEGVPKIYEDGCEPFY